MTYDPQVPAFLLAFQNTFSRILIRPLRDLGEYDLPQFDPATCLSIEEQFTAGPRLTSAQCIGIYNQQFWYRMYILLQAEYPTLLTLFGYEEFNRLIAEPYILSRFPHHWSLHQLGRALPQWIAEEYKDEDKSLIYQIALLEDIYERLLFAYPEPPLRDMNGPIYLQPTVEIIQLEGDLVAFRNELLSKEVDDWHEFPQIDWSKPRYFTCDARGGEVYAEEISLSEFTLLQAFQRGAALKQACGLLSEGEQSEDQIALWLQKWAARGWFRDGKELGSVLL